MPYEITRPLMTRQELENHRTGGHGRDYTESDDGYGDMHAEEKRGWTARASWGRDGWNLGDWPYVAIYTRTGSPGATDRIYELMQIVEGDRTTWAFYTPEDRDAAIDYLFLWYAAGERWAPLTWEDRDKLDAGHLTVDDRFRGPYRSQES